MLSINLIAKPPIVRIATSRFTHDDVIKEKEQTSCNL